MKVKLLNLCLIFSVSGCQSGDYWDLLVHSETANVVETFAIEGFDSKQDCEKVGEKEYKDATRLCVKRKLTL
ncbi:MAG: hypothetical protein ACPG3T_05350 [Pseudomonadales bacterium]